MVGRRSDSQPLKVPAEKLGETDRLSAQKTETKCVRQVSQSWECKTETRTEFYDMERESRSSVRGGKSHQSSAEEASMRHIAQVNGILSYTTSQHVSEDTKILQATINTFLNMKLFCNRYKKL
jgi:hypothetical protein